MIHCTGIAFIVVSMSCTQPATPVVDTFCTNYKPVYWATKDTRKSKVANDINNRRWKELCKGEKR